MTKLGAGNAVGDLIVFDGTSWIVLPVNATSTPQFVMSFSGASALKALAALVSNPTNPTETTSVTAVHDGLALYITPTATGRIRVIIGLDAYNTGAYATYSQIRYGTGTAPANAAAPTGTALGVEHAAVGAAAGFQIGMCILAGVTGLTVGTQYWFDLVKRTSNSSGAARHYNVDVQIIEY